METALAVTTPTHVDTVRAGFDTAGAFELLQRQAKMLASSDLVPQQFKGNISNCIIGLEMANRLGASPLAVFQNLYIVHGKPSWSAQFITAAINSTGRFSPLRFQMEGEGDSRVCTAWALEKSTGERLEGPPVSIKMAKAEGWVDKSGSKWKTMPELMLRYRAATFFGRLYAPEVLMGMETADEIIDVYDVQTEAQQATQSKVTALKDKLKKQQEVIELAPGPCPPEGPMSGDTPTADVCAECSMRDGCPTWPVTE